MRKRHSLHTYHEINHKLLRQIDQGTTEQAKAKKRSIFWPVFFGIITAVITLSLLAFGTQIALLTTAANVIKSTFEQSSTNKQPIATTTPSYRRTTPTPKKPTLTATRNQKEGDDMPPWEHPHKWGKISSEHGTCWYHYKTMEKVCE